MRPAKSQNQQQRPTPCNKQRMTIAFSQAIKHIELEQRSPTHAKPSFRSKQSSHQKWKLKAHKSYQLSTGFPSSNAAICNPACHQQATFTNPSLQNSYSATPTVPFNSGYRNVIDTISKRWLRSSRAFPSCTFSHLSRSHEASLKPKRCASNTIDYITGLTEKIKIHELSGLKTSVGVQRGKGGPTRGSKVFNTIIQMGAGPPARQLSTNSATARKALSSGDLFLGPSDAPSFSSKQSSHQTKSK